MGLKAELQFVESFLSVICEGDVFLLADLKLVN
jgi:hypothetical protein